MRGGGLGVGFIRKSRSILTASVGRLRIRGLAHGWICEGTRGLTRVGGIVDLRRFVAKRICQGSRNRGFVSFWRGWADSCIPGFRGFAHLRGLAESWMCVVLARLGGVVHSWISRIRAFARVGGFVHSWIRGFAHTLYDCIRRPVASMQQTLITLMLGVLYSRVARRARMRSCRFAGLRFRGFAHSRIRTCVRGAVRIGLKKSSNTHEFPTTGSCSAPPHSQIAQPCRRSLRTILRLPEAFRGWTTYAELLEHTT